MNLNYHKLPLVGNTKAFLNNSLALKNNKLNKSRTLLKNSVLRCALKENNTELARTLALKEVEISEMRKENNRLMRENFDLTHTGQYRAYNFNSYMLKFSELSDVALSIFTEVCKLSDELVEMKCHPFLVGDNSNSDVVFNDSSLPEGHVPSPFLAKDKIRRSPLHSLNDANETQIDTVDYLASKIVMIKNQSNNSIHNLSTNFNNSTFMTQRPANKADTSQYILNIPPSPKNIEQQSDPVNKPEPKVIRDTRRKKKCEEEMLKIKVSRKKPSLKDDDPMFMPRGTPKTTQRRKKASKLKPDNKKSNKEEYIKNKEMDAYHLSINETINTSILPPSLNEYKNQQKMTNAVEVVKETEQVEVVKIVEQRQGTSPPIRSDRNPVINFKDDDDDFILSKPIKSKKRPNVEDNKANDLDNVEDHTVAVNDPHKESVAKEALKETVAKPKLAVRSKRKAKETNGVTDENVSPDKVITEKKKRRKNNTENVEVIKQARIKSNLSIIIDKVNAGTDVTTNVKEATKGRGKKKKTLIMSDDEEH